MKIKPIREKDELLRIIKALAKDLEARAEAIADDYNTKVRKIDIHTSIEIDCINEWEITKYYPVIVDEVVIKPSDDNKSIKAQAEIIAPAKVNPAEGIAKAVNESIIKNPCDIKIGIDYGDGLSKSSMFGGDG